MCSPKVPDTSPSIPQGSGSKAATDAYRNPAAATPTADSLKAVQSGVSSMSKPGIFGFQLPLEQRYDVDRTKDIWRFGVL